MKASLKSLRTLPGRVWRDIGRKRNRQDEGQCAKAAKVSILTAQKPKAVFVDKGYRGVSVDGVTIWRSGQKRGVTPSIRKAIFDEVPLNPQSGA